VTCTNATEPSMQSTNLLILRRPRSGRLEGPATGMQMAAPSVTAKLGCCRVWLQTARTVPPRFLPYKAEASGLDPGGREGDRRSRWRGRVRGTAWPRPLSPCGRGPSSSARRSRALARRGEGFPLTPRIATQREAGRAGEPTALAGAARIGSRREQRRNAPPSPCFSNSLRAQEKQPFPTRGEDMRLRCAHPSSGHHPNDGGGGA
jgi:hypothetical protein